MTELLEQVRAAGAYALPVLWALWDAVAAAAGVSWLPWVMAAFALGKSLNGPWGMQTGKHYGKAVLYGAGAFILAAAAAGLWGAR